MVRAVSLDELARGTVAADGTCVVSIGPVRRQTWKPSNVGVQCTSASATAKLYLGPSKSGQYMGGTYDGTNDNMPVGITLTQGALITVVWEGATPGDLCTLTVVGTMEVYG